MSIKRNLLDDFGASNLLDACKLLVEQHAPRNGNTKFNLSELAHHLGIRVEVHRAIGFDGRLQTTADGTSVATLSAFSGRRRSRFTLAHEIGHRLLRMNCKVDVKTAYRGVGTTTVADAEEEEVANLIAAELLMPIEVVQSRLRASQIGLPFIYSITKHFDVSFKAAMRRIADAANTPFLYLNVVPHRFRDLNTFSEVDEEMYVWPMQRSEFERGRTKLVKPYCFNDIKNARRVRLCVRGPFGQLLGEFDVRYGARPFPNCDLLTLMHGGMFRDIN